MALTDSLISGPIPIGNDSYSTATAHSITALCPTISWNECNGIFTLGGVKGGTVIRRCAKAYVASFLSSKSSSRCGRRVASNCLRKVSKHKYIDRCTQTCGCDNARCATPAKDRVGNIVRSTHGEKCNPTSASDTQARAGRQRNGFRPT